MYMGMSVVCTMCIVYIRTFARFLLIISMSSFFLLVATRRSMYLATVHAYYLLYEAGYAVVDPPTVLKYDSKR
jgi:hypothetical protein